MKILSCGAGMQSTALALISCDQTRNAIRYPEVPTYDAVVYCALGCDPVWVDRQVDFIQEACDACDIPFYILQSDLYGDYMKNFGHGRVSCIPFWTLDERGKKGRMPYRACTMDYKVRMIQKFVRQQLLGYQAHQRTRAEDIGAHELHIGFSGEETQRMFESRHLFFINRFPLIQMGWTRADCYRYSLEEWGLETKGSSCLICPFHQNFFFQHLKDHVPHNYETILEFDQMLKQRQPLSKIRNQLFISKSRKRIKDLEPDECNDAQTFDYQGQQIWNGF